MTRTQDQTSPLYLEVEAVARWVLDRTLLCVLKAVATVATRAKDQALLCVLKTAAAVATQARTRPSSV